MVPDKDGWWLFDEGGLPGQQYVLVFSGCVAADYEWEESVGREPIDCENYWEGEPVANMPEGSWTFLGTTAPKEIK